MVLWKDREIKMEPALGITTNPQRKRGSEEHNSTNSADGDNSSEFDNNNETTQNQQKKLKLTPVATQTKPSRVVHIRNIPTDINETEIIHLGIPFGHITNVLVLKGKNQAFLELADEASAIAMVTYFTNCSAQLRGRSVYVQYSTHTELKTDQSHSNANSAAQAALQAAQVLVGQQQHPALGLQQMPVAAQQNLDNIQGGPNTVLRIIVEQMLYPVTLDVLYQIFSRMGKILRIVTFTKSGFFQALIQFPDVVSAQAAKLTLDGQNIYNGCCTLRIEYSKLSSLNVRYNNDKSRDYTNPTLPTGESLDTSFQQQLNNLASGGHHHHGNNNFVAAAAAAAAAAAGLHYPHNNSGFLGQQQGGAGLGNNYSMGGPLPMGFANLAAAAAAAANLPSSMRLQQQQNVPGCVLLVSNLNEESINPDHLFTLFGVYGDVSRVKILFNKKDSALIQMKEPSQAQLAMTYLDRLKIFSKSIRVTISKHNVVQLPKEGQPDAGLTKDYTNSSLHRFKKPDSKNYLNIYAPSATLHLSNIPSCVSDTEICDAFKNNNFTIKGFKFFPSKDRKMALLQLPSIEDSAEALIKMHNYQLRENSHLRVSFSKSTI